MGFRAGDVVGLRLDDIEWEQAWIRVSGKGRRQMRLPLTQEIGDAISAYLLYGPATLQQRCRQPTGSAIARLDDAFDFLSLQILR